MSNRSHAVILGKVLAANGPVTREQLVTLFGQLVPPEKAFRMARRRDKDMADADSVRVSGVQQIITSGLHGWATKGLIVERDGYYHATGRFRRDAPELFVEELRSKPELYTLGIWMAKEIDAEAGARHGKVSRNRDSGLRHALRQMLKMVGRLVDDMGNGAKPGADLDDTTSEENGDERRDERGGDGVERGTEANVPGHG